MIKTILIDPGHDRKNPGAFSAPFAEKTLNLKAALACRDFLAAYECKVVMTRDTDIFVSVGDRYNQAIALGAAASICMHHNAGGGDGGEVWFWHTDSAAKTLAALIASEYRAIGQNLRTGPGMPEGVKPSSTSGSNFGMCREPAKRGIPAILGEYAFIDNVTDRLIVDTDAEVVAQGNAYGRAVVKFLGLQIKNAVKPPVETPVSFAVKTDGVLNIRTGPSTDAEDVGDTVPGKVYQVSKTAMDANNAVWYYIGAGWIAGWYCIKYTPPIVPAPVPAAPKAGDIFNLYGKPLYISATAKFAVRKLTGTYYLYDSQIVNGRYRITNSPKNVGKKPAGWYVTGWIAM